MQQKLKWDGNESKDEVDAQTIHAMVLIIVQLSLSSTWCILWDVIFWKYLFVSFVANISYNKSDISKFYLWLQWLE